MTIIKAEVHSDDYLVEVEFDAEPFFLAATAEKILALAACGWGGKEPADAVAEYMETRDKAVGRLFTYLSFEPRSYGEPVGFECHVDEGDALAWLAAQRPDVLAALDAAGEG
jgi:hypothetical protein